MALIQYTMGDSLSPQTTANSLKSLNLPLVLLGNLKTQKVSLNALIK